jgi:YidC/Oxa1 family membrane protein insertase
MNASLLSSGPHLLAAQHFWILDPIYTAMGTVLAWLYAVVPSYGLAIALLTVAVRVLLIPLTTKQVKSQQAMQRIQPELKRLQAKYKDDRVKLNEEMMKFYKENKVNPVAGCLPLLLQTPLFLVLYRLILGLTHKPTPKHLPASSELYRSLVQSGGKMVSWGVDLAQSASSQKGLAHAFPFYVLIALTIATGFYQQRQMTARMPAGSANAQMKMIGRVFPIMIGLISFRIPAGVVVYFIVSNIWQIGQQELTFRHLGPVGGEPAKGEKAGGKPAGGNGRGGGGAGGATGSGRGGKSPAAGGANNKAGGKKPANNQRQPGKAGAPPQSNKAQSGKPQAGKPQSSKSQPSKSQPAKGKRPPPSPRPKGLPEAGPRNGQQNPSAKNIPPRKDS